MDVFKLSDQEYIQICYDEHPTIKRVKREYNYDDLNYGIINWRVIFKHEERYYSFIICIGINYSEVHHYTIKEVFPSNVIKVEYFEKE